MAPLIIKSSIPIKASPSKVWKVLTRPEYTKLYMFGCEVDSDWKVNSSVEWKGYEDLKETVYVKGKVVKINPEKTLVYTTFDPQGGLPDIPENYLSVSYDLKDQTEQTVLTITQGDFSNVAEGEDRYSEAVKGWKTTLAEIKHLAETEDKEC